MSDLEDKFQEVFKDDELEQAVNNEGIESIVCKNFYNFIYNVESEWPINDKIQ